MSKKEEKTYILGQDHKYNERGEFSHIEPFILCLLCKRKSYNHNDIEQRFCNSCKRFHESDETHSMSRVIDMRHDKL